MRCTQRLLVVFLVLILAASVPLTALAAPSWAKSGWMPPGQAKKGDKYGWLFLDAEEAPWAFPYFAELALKDIFQGDDNGYVRPNQSVKVIEAIALVVRLMGKEAEAQARSTSPLPYADARSIPDWARGYVAVALEQGLIAAHDGKLDPNKAAERMVVTVMLVRAIGREAQAQARMNETLPFRDAASVPGWARGYLVVALDLGILTGYSDRTVQPHKPVTRAEMAALLSRAGQYLDSAYQSEVVGEVVAVRTAAPRTLTLRHGDTTTTYPVASYCAVYDGTAEKDLGDLKPGDRVKAYLNAAGEVVLVSIQARQVTREGTLEQLVPPAGNTAGQVTITDAGGARLSWALAPGAQAVAAGQAIPFSQLTPGCWVIVYLEGNLAAKIELVTAQAVRGTVVSTGLNQHGHPATIKLQLANTGTATYQVMAAVQVTYRNQAGAFADLCPGDQVEVSLQDGKVSRIVILVKVQTATGIVVATQVNQYGHPSAITLRGPVSYQVAADVTTVNAAGGPLAFAAVNPGDEVELHLEDLVVRRIRVLGQVALVTGTVVETGCNAFGHPESIALKLADGSQRSCAVAADVRVTLSGAPIAFAAILPGDRATLKLEGDLVREIAIAARPEVRSGEVVARRLTAFGHPEAIVIRSDDGREHEFPVAVTVQVTYAGQPYTFVNIRVGDRVEVRLEAGTAIAIQILARTVEVVGALVDKAVNAYGHPVSVTLRVDGQNRTCQVAPDLKVYRDGAPATFASLLVEDYLQLTVEGGVATTATVLVRADAFTGIIKALNSADRTLLVRVTVAGAGGAPVTVDRLVKVTSTTVISRGGQPLTFAELVLENRVTVTCRVEEGKFVALTIVVQ